MTLKERLSGIAAASAYHIAFRRGRSCAAPLSRRPRRQATIE